MDPGSPSLRLRLRRWLGRIRRRFVVDAYDIFLRRVPEDARFEAPEGYVFRFGTAADIQACEPFHTDLDERERAAGVKRLGLDHRVVLGLHQGRVVFSMWVNPRCLNVPGLLKRGLGPHQWFIYKAFTSPEHRGRKLYESGMRFVLAEMRAARLTELVGYAHLKKAVSRKGLAALAFRTGGRVTQIDSPFQRWTRLSPDLLANFPREVPRSHAVKAETGLPRSA